MVIVATDSRNLQKFAFSVLPAALEEPPPSIELSPWSLSAIQVSWSPLSFELLRGYVIFYKSMKSPGRRKRSAPPLAEFNETITSLNTSRRFLTGLNEFTNYSVQAAGFTDFEVGPRTITVYIITNQTGERMQ